jgi:hypothetical protein
MTVTDVVIGDHPVLPRVLNTRKNGLMTLVDHGIQLPDGTVLTWAIIRSYKLVPKLEKPVAEEAPKPRRKTPARRGRPKKGAAGKG